MCYAILSVGDGTIIQFDWLQYLLLQSFGIDYILQYTQLNYIRNYVIMQSNDLMRANVILYTVIM